MFVAIITLPPSAGLPPHRHSKEDEFFYVLQGSVRFEGEESGSRVLHAGEGFWGPRSKMHSFYCEGESPAKLLGTGLPGAGLQAMYGDIEQATLTGSVDAMTIANICERYGISFLPPPTE